MVYVPLEIVKLILRANQSCQTIASHGIEQTMASVIASYKGLRIAALVHNKWTPIAQQELFRKIVVLGDENEKLGKAMEASPHLKKYRGQTEMVIFINDSKSSKADVSWISRCTNLLEISITRSDVVDFALFSNLINLERLYLQDCILTFTSTRYFPSPVELPSLSTLSLLRCIGDGEVIGITSDSFPGLKSLALSNLQDLQATQSYRLETLLPQLLQGSFKPDSLTTKSAKQSPSLPAKLSSSLQYLSTELHYIDGLPDFLVNTINIPTVQLFLHQNGKGLSPAEQIKILQWYFTQLLGGLSRLTPRVPGELNLKLEVERGLRRFPPAQRQKHDKILSVVKMLCRGLNVEFRLTYRHVQANKSKVTKVK